MILISSTDLVNKLIVDGLAKCCRRTGQSGILNCNKAIHWLPIQRIYTLYILSTDIDDNVLEGAMNEMSDHGALLLTLQKDSHIAHGTIQITFKHSIHIDRVSNSLLKHSIHTDTFSSSFLYSPEALH